MDLTLAQPRGLYIGKQELALMLDGAVDMARKVSSLS